MNIETDSGQDLSVRYNISAVPAYVLLDARGTMIYRQVGGRPNSDEIETRLRNAERAAEQ